MKVFKIGQCAIIRDNMDIIVIESESGIIYEIAYDKATLGIYEING